MERERLPVLLSGFVAGLLCIAGWGCSSEPRANGGESVSSTQAADLVPPPGVLAGNSNYWITAASPDAGAGIPITGLDISIAATQDLEIPNGMSIQLNGWSAPTSNVVWQQYGFSVTPPSLGWGIENWPTTAYGAQLGLPSGGSLNFPGSLEPNLPTVPYGPGILPAGYILDIVFHDDASGNITGTTYRVTDLCGNTSSIGPVDIVGTSLAASGAQGTIPASALAPIYGLQLNLVNMPGSTFVFSSGAGTISYRANETLYVSNHQPSWTAAQGIVTGENSDIAYSELSSTPSNPIVQQFGLAACECSGSSCEMPSGSYADSCTGCAVATSGSGCVLTCTSCGTIGGSQNPNPSLQLPCAGSLSNGSVTNSNGSLQLQCTFVPSPDAGVRTGVDAGCGPGACVTPDGPYLGSCTGCAAASSGSGCVLTCTSCTMTDGSENPDPSLALPCSGSIENDNGALECSGGASDAGSGSQDGGSPGGPDGSIGGSMDAASSDDASHGGGSSGGGSSGGDGGVSVPGSAGCSCSLSALETASPVQSFATLAVAAVIGFGRRRRAKDRIDRLACVLCALLLLLGCGTSKSGFSGDGGGVSSGGPSGGGSGGAGTGGSSGSTGGLFGDGGAGAGDAGASCNPPDVLIVLDHTDSMSAEPTGTQPPNTAAGHLLSKWYLATQAIKAVVAPPMDEQIAYGLEPFPLDPQVITDAGATGVCQTLTGLLGGMRSNNTSCEPGEVLVAPATGTGAKISSILDPETMRLCVSTPIALALGTARTELAAVVRSGSAQYVLLVTDGGETCKGDVTSAAQQLASAGIKTFVVGFGAADAGSGGVNKKLLDDVACAGMTAVGFPAPCTKGPNGYTATKTAGAPLFYLAEDGPSLQSALHAIASSVCCGCTQ
jgi:von Willebrand factor type A domain